MYWNRTGSNPKIRRNKIWGGQNGGILVYNSGKSMSFLSVLGTVGMKLWQTGCLTMLLCWFQVWASLRTMKYSTTQWQGCGLKPTATPPYAGTRSMMVEMVGFAYLMVAEVSLNRNKTVCELQILFFPLQYYIMWCFCIWRNSGREWHFQERPGWCAYKYKQSPCIEEEPNIWWLCCRWVCEFEYFYCFCRFFD